MIEILITLVIGLVGGAILQKTVLSKIKITYNKK